MSQGAMSRGPSHQGEADRIYRAIFRRSAPAIIERRFLEASKPLEQKASPGELERYHRALEEVRDLEALEIACRYTRKLPLLCLKFRLAVHLAETLPENQRFLVNEEANVARARWALFAGAIGTALKLAKGLCILTRLRYA